MLKSYDYITIRPDPYYNERQKVTVNGEVYFPGEYVISGPNELVSNIIKRAGGLKPGAYADGKLMRGGREVRVSFEKLLKRPRSKYNFKVSDGDEIIIGSYPNLVEVNGAVHAPGNFQFFESKNVKDYLEIAGGINDQAARNGIFISYPDGTSAKYSNVFPFSTTGKGMVQ